VIAGGPRFADTSSDSAKQAIVNQRAQQFDWSTAEPEEFDWSTAEEVPAEKFEEKPAGTMEVGPTKEAAKNPLYVVGPKPKGMVEQGNIDLNNRPILHNEDGTISSERSFSFEEDGKEVLIPKIVNGKELPAEDAIAHYRQTGEHMGKFADVASADAYAETAHNRPMQEQADKKRQVGVSEDIGRSYAQKIGQYRGAVEEHVISPALDLIDSAAQSVAPGTEVSKFISGIKANYQDSLKQRSEADKGVEFDQNKEHRSFLGEVSGNLAKLSVDLPIIAQTAQAIPLRAGAGIAARLTHGAASMTIPGASAGKEAADAVKKRGGSAAQQAKAFIRAMVETQAMGAIPLGVESKAATMAGRVAGRTAKAVPLASATVEGVRDVQNLLSPVTGDEYQPFSLEENIKNAIPLAIMGGVMGRNTSEPKAAPANAGGGPGAAPGTYRTSEKTPRHPADKLIGTSSVEVGGKTKYTYTWISSQQGAPGTTGPATAPMKQANARVVGAETTGTPIYRQGRRDGNWWTESEEYAKSFGKKSAGIQTAALPKDAKIFDASDPKKLRSVATPEEIKGMGSMDPAVSRKAYNDFLNRTGHDAIKILDEDASGNTQVSYFLKNTPSGQPLGIVANPAFAKAAAIKQARARLGQRRRIDPLHVNPKRFYEGAADILDRGGFKDLANRVRDWADNRAALTARWDNPFRLWAKGVSKADQKLVDDQVRAYGEAVDKNDLPRAKALYNAAHPKTKEFINTAKRVLDDISNETRRSGVKVFDPIRKTWRPIRKVPNFVPRRVKPEWLKILGDPHKYPLEYEALKREMVAKGYAKDAANAAKHLDRVKEEHLGAGEVSGIERARYSKLPSHMYDYGTDTVRRYVVATARELARIKAFGQSQGGKQKQETAFDKAQKGVDDYSSAYVKSLEDVIYDKPEDYSSVARPARSFSTLSALGNYLSSMRNLFSGVMFNLQHHGIRSGMKSLLDAKGTFKSIDEAYEKGILHDDLANMMTSDVTDAGQRLNKFTNKVLKWNLYRGVEEFTRAMSMVGAKAKLREAIRETQKDPTSDQALRNAAQFKRLGIDPQALLDENGSGPLTDRYLRADVAEVQGGYTVAQTPVGMNKEVGKTLFHLQKWGTQALRHFDHNVLTPALRSIKLARKENVNIKDASGNMVNREVPGDLKPLVRYMLLLPAFGLAQKEAQSWLFGTPDREASFAEILMRMDDDALDAFGMLAHKLFTASINVGLLGTIGNYYQAIQARGLEGAAAPAPFQILGNVKSLIEKAYDQGKLTGDDIRKFITDQFSGVRVTTGSLAQVGPLREQVPYLQEAKLRQDMSWFRSVMRRFEDDEKIVRPPPIRGEVGKGPMAHVYEDIKNKLFLGDAEGARALINEQTKGMKPAEKKIAMDSLKKSVSASRPIKAGGSNSEAVRKYVLQWAEKKMPPEDVLRIKEIDDTYRKTAIRLQLLSPKPVKDLQGEIKKFKMRNALRAGELGED
jgi:hypothetical protein